MEETHKDILEFLDKEINSILVSNPSNEII